MTFISAAEILVARNFGTLIAVNEMRPAMASTQEITTGDLKISPTIEKSVVIVETIEFCFFRAIAYTYHRLST